MLKPAAAGLAVLALVAQSVAIADLLWTPAPPAAPAPPIDPPDAGPPPWLPPPWLPGAAVDPLAVAALDGPNLSDRGPRLRARAAFVADLDRGEVLWSRRADERFPVASLTKLVSALALAAAEPALDRRLCVGPEQYPTRSGARSRFETGVCHVGWDWLGSALVASDNRGAMGFPALVDTRYQDFVASMDEVSGALGLQQHSWTDPTGIEENDMASARDMAKAVVAVAAHPVLSTVASAPTWTIDRRHGPQTLTSTNRLVRSYETLAAKTGYTDPARYCFASVVRHRGATYATVVLGAPTSSARFAATRALLEWASRRETATGS